MDTIPFTTLGWILTLINRTRDTILSGLVCRDGYWPGLFLLLRRDGYWHWILRLGMFLLLHQDGYWHYDLWFFMLFWTMTGITKYHKLWSRIVTRASSLSFPQRWWVLPCKCNCVLLCPWHVHGRSHDIFPHCAVFYRYHRHWYAMIVNWNCMCGKK
jgi:PAS domain-containing protein